MKTYNDVYLNARKKLRAAGIEAHDLETRLIIAYATGKSREELLSVGNEYLTQVEKLKEIDALLDRRIDGEPVAYIVGEWEFYGIPVKVSKAVLIPRVDTEVLAEKAIELLKMKSGQKRLLDLCAGCGCVGLAAAANVKNCRVVLADNSEAALAVCRQNMLGNRLSKMTMAVTADALEAPPAILGAFDMIVCNPPYIPSAHIESLDRSVKDYEPLSALDGGQDGLNFFRKIAANWSDIIKTGGHMVFECGVGQADAVCEIMRNTGFLDIKKQTDTLGIERVVYGIKGGFSKSVT